MPGASLGLTGNGYGYVAAMMRILLVLPVFFASLMTAPSAQAEPTCHITIFEGVATAVDCPADSHISTYKYKDGVPPGSEFNSTLPQTLHSTGDKQANVPDCAWQADVYTGETLPVIDENHQYHERLLAFLSGGDVACAQAATTTAPTTTEVTTTTMLATTIARQPTPSTLARTGSSDHARNMVGVSTGLFVLGAGALVAAAERKRQYVKR